MSYNGWEQCPACCKWVRNKIILGTLHLCLTEEEQIYQEMARRQIELQKRVSAAFTLEEWEKVVKRNCPDPPSQPQYPQARDG